MMSSETSIEARLAASAKAPTAKKPDASPLKTDSAALQPWQFFVLAALGCATAVTFIARGRGFTSVILLTLLMGAAALVGLAVLRTVQPLVSPDEDRTVVIRRRTRAALAREKMMVLRAIKELEFDRAMGKLSEGDFKEMSTRLRSRAARLMRQLDAGDGYRSQIEHELEKRLTQAEADARLKPSRDDDTINDALARPSHYADSDAKNRPAKGSTEPADRSATALAERVCASCSTANDLDARFCKGCGSKL
jgi:hypothetical protein